MNKKTHDIIIKHHTELYQKFGGDKATLGDPRGHYNIKFKVMSEIGELNNSKILDVGCGWGDFLTYLNNEKVNIKYTGVDINPEFIKTCKSNHKNANFFEMDIEKEKFNDKFDYVFGVGITSLMESYDSVKKLMTEMFKISEKGIALNFMSTYVDFQKKESSHFSPEKIFSMSKKLSRRVVIRHDYLPFEFCVYIYKNNSLTEKLTYSDIM